VAELGEQLVAARTDLVGLFAPRFGDAAQALGLEAAELRYDGTSVSVMALEAALQRDLDRGTTGIGPHLDDVAVTARGRDLRIFGSQGEQRLAVLALLLAEADVLRDRRGMAPLLLLDDVLSELDEQRRRSLATWITRAGQALVTATSSQALPVDADVLVEVSPGTARRVR
jgi:DNA replication and repair protein RecF